MKNDRILSIELLRVFCIIGIITMHILSPLISHEQYFLLSNLENSLFNTGVTVFMFISGYFSIKFNVKKIVKYYFMLLFISWMHFLLLTFIRIANGSRLSYADVRQLISLAFPLLTGNRWFFSCYFLLYILSPVINYTIETYLKKDRKSFSLIILSFLLFLYIAPTLMFNGIAYNYAGKELITMIFVYLLARYVYIYKLIIPNNKLNVILWVLIYIMTVIANNLAIKITNQVVFARDNSLLILIQSYLIFSVFINITIDFKKIIVLSKYVFPIFLYQPIFTETLFPIVNYEYMINKTFSEQFLIVIIYVSLTIVFSVFLEKIRLLLFCKLENKFICKCENAYNSFMTIGN